MSTHLAAAYIRMSSNKQEDSPERQRQQITALAARLGVEVIEWYVDEGIPGDEVRPDFERLQRDAKRPDRRWGLLLVDTQSRLSRHLPARTIKAVLDLQDAGIRLESMKGTIDVYDIVNLLRSSVDGHSDNQYLKTMSSNVLSGMKRAFTAGKSVGRRMLPLGYERGPGGQLMVKGDEALVVREIFDLAVAGMVPRLIAATLISRGDTSRKWSKNVVVAILQNPVYVGDTVFGRRTSAKYYRLSTDGAPEPVPERRPEPQIGPKKPGNRVCRKQPKTAWLVRSNTHEAIVSRQTFDTVAAIMARRQRGPTDDKRPRIARGNAPLSGLMVCDACGLPMTTERQSGRRSYVCAENKQLGPSAPHGCGRHGITEVRAFRCILATLRGVIEQPEWRERYEAYYRAEQERLSKPDDDIPPMQEAAARLRGKLDKLVDTLADAPPTSRPAIHKRIAETQGEIDRTEESIQRKSRQAAEMPPDADDVVRSIAELEQLAEQAAQHGEPEIYQLAAAIREIVVEVRVRFETWRVQKITRGRLIGGDVRIRPLFGDHAATVQLSPEATNTASRDSRLGRFGFVVPLSLVP